MSGDGNVVDLAEVRVTRECMDGLEDIVRHSLRAAVSNVAILHGGQSDDWIERKARVCTDVILEIVEASKEPVRLSLPRSLSEEEIVQIEGAVIAWGLTRTERCLKAFAERLVELLEP